MKTKRTKTLAVLTASLLSLSVAGQAAEAKRVPTPKQESTPINDIKIGNRSQFSNRKEAKPERVPTPKQESTPKNKQSSPTKTNQIDLRNKSAGMNLHDGQNLIHSGDGVKLMAEARNNKIVGWSATDDKGKKLPTTVEKDSAGKVTGVRVSGRPQTLAFKIGRF